MIKSKKNLLCLSSIVIGILLAALVGELAMRLGGYSPIHVNALTAFHEPDRTVGYRGKPNFTGRFHRPDFDVMISHDQNGFRKQEYQNPKETSRHQIFVFGDSFTWGWGVGQGKVFTDRMSLLMPDYHIKNFGLNGSGTVQQFTVFEAYAKETVQPGDTVVLMFSQNDFKDNGSGYLHAEVIDGQVRRIELRRTLSSRSTFNLKHASYLINYLDFSFEVLKATFEEARANKRAHKLVSVSEQSREMIVTRHFLAEFQKAVAEKQARFVAVYISIAEAAAPSGTASAGLSRKRAFQKAFYACAEPLDLQTLDLEPYFLKARSSGRYDRFVFERDRHWNDNGHAVVGEALAEFILRADGVRTLSSRRVERTG